MDQAPGLHAASRPLKRRAALGTLAAGAAAVLLPALQGCGPAKAASTSTSTSSSTSASTPLLPTTGTSTWPVDPGKAQPTAGWSMYATSGSKLELVTFGNDIWNAADNCGFYGEQWTGDGDWSCRVADLANTNQWAKAGIMLRQTLAAGSVDANIVYNYGHGVQLNVRIATNHAAQSGTNGGLDPSALTPLYLRLQRKGDTVTVWDGTDGKTWTHQSSVTMTKKTPLPKYGAIPPITDPFYVGVVACSHDPHLQGVAAFDHLTGWKHPTYTAIYQKSAPYNF